MNYRHIYHAGNFADVFKHWVLSLILSKLCIKDAPFCAIDTHAGLGMYDLNHPNAQKTLEASSGIDRLQNKSVVAAFHEYMQIVQSYTTSHNCYPGSAAIMNAFLRDQDRLLLNELQPEDHDELQNNFAGNSRIKIYQQDAYQFLKAMLPPKERRGVILIDPPFEKTNELSLLASGIQEAIKRFATGVYLIWIPIKDRKEIDKFYRTLSQTKLPPIMIAEIHAREQILPQLQNCGLMIINPPWQLEETLRANLPKLMKYLELSKATYNITYLSNLH